MATGLERELPTPKANDNNVNTSVMFPKENSYARGKVIGQKEIQMVIPLEGEMTTPYLTCFNIVLKLMMERSVN